MSDLILPIRRALLSVYNKSGLIVLANALSRAGIFILSTGGTARVLREAGFNIKESIELWKRMKESQKGKKPPQFLSTHPSTENRIENLKRWVNEIIIEYPPIKS